MTLVDKQTWQAWQDQAQTLMNRSLDRHLRLAVTGLSRSGKTAFITSLVYQLEQLGLSARLPHCAAWQEGRLLGARRVAQLRHHVPTFPYQEGLRSLAATPPQWPDPTRSVSEIRLEIRFRSGHPLLRRLGSDLRTLSLDLVDYPGEWLLDLPLLDQSYADWSASMQAQLAGSTRLAQTAEPWLALGRDLALQDTYDEARLATLAAAYTAWLHQCKDTLGLSLIQPGRFVLPGDYAGAPMLQFVPWVWGAVSGDIARTNWLGVLTERFEHYKQHVVQGFYREHFASFDRQIVLVDCLAPLQAGPEAFADLENTLALLLKSFHYGQSSWLRRLFAPRIDRLLFAASKADHVTPDQHASLHALLRNLVQRAYGLAQFEGIDIECLPFASVRASEYRKVSHQGRELYALSGQTQRGESVHLFPGEVPPARPAASYWQQDPAKGFAFLSLRPPVWSQGQPMPHLRLDHIIDWLLGDKLA